MTERSYAWPQSLNRLDAIQEEGKDDDAVEPPHHGVLPTRSASLCLETLFSQCPSKTYRP
jgi:hypothetical protein